MLVGGCPMGANLPVSAAAVVVHPVAAPLVSVQNGAVPTLGAVVTRDAESGSPVAIIAACDADSGCPVTAPTLSVLTVTSPPVTPVLAVRGRQPGWCRAAAGCGCQAG